MSRSRDFRTLALTGVAISTLGFGGVAFAQQNGAEDEDVVITTTEEAEEQDESRQERVVVTGSLLRRSEFTSAAPIQVITAETATLEGLVDTAEILQGSSIAAGSTQINGNFGGFVVEGGTGVNTVSLRGLGGQRTLVLFNGRRLGPSGTQGQVGAVDLNVIPDAVVGRYEILKDGASSIYGSDAVAGVVNVITRREIDGLELNFDGNLPEQGGGESFGVNGAYGLSFDRGSVVLSASYERFEDLTTGDRDAFTCPQDYVFDLETGARRDLIDPSTGEFKCFNLFTDAYDINAGPRLILGDDGTFFERAPGNDGLVQQVYQNPQVFRQDVIPQTERVSLYATGDYDFGFAEGFVDLLYNNRKTENNGVRQFFPFLGPAVAPEAFPGTFARPIVFFPSDVEVDIDYYSATAGLRGDFGVTDGFLSSWTWEVAGVYSRSEGRYENTAIPLNRTEDFARPGDTASYFVNEDGSVGCSYVPEDQLQAFFDDDPNTTAQRADCPVFDFFSPQFISGQLTPEQADWFIEQDVGNTVYEQTTFTALTTGELFDLPAGAVGVGLGIEYREYSLDDMPGIYSRGTSWTRLDEDGNPVLGVDGQPIIDNQSNSWGRLSAVQTVGEDNVFEAFAELEVPILANQPFAEEFTINVSGRYFDYESFGSDSVYKASANWQITPAVRVRSTLGTSYRTPALYELFLGNQTSFLGQGDVDPCIEWGDSANPNIRTNCAAQGVPEDYEPGIGSSSAQITTGGGVGNLDPETSDALTFGLIYTPAWSDLSIALDYFEITIDDQIAQFGAGAIAGACYGSEQPFDEEPFCQLVTRDLDPNSPRFLEVLGIRDNYVNINSQETSGLDITVRYEQETTFADFVFDMQGTWTFDDKFQLFGEDDPDDFNGSIGDPDFVANARLQMVKGDFRYTWSSDFVSRASNDEVFGGSVFGYRGLGDTYYKQFIEPQWYHAASIQYEGDTFTVTGGLRNIFDEDPPFVSTGAATRRGNAALVGTQYDYRGRSLFVGVSKEF